MKPFNLNLKNNSIFISNLTFLFGENTIKILLSVVSSIIIPRFLGPTQYGVFNYVISFGILFSTFYNFGADDYFIDKISKAPSDKERNQLLADAFWIRLFGGGVGFLITTLCALIFISSIHVRLLVGLYSGFMLFKCVENINCFLIAQKNNRKIALIRTLISALFSIAKIYTVMIHKDLDYLIYLASLEFLIFAFGYLTLYHLNGWKINWPLNRLSLKKQMSPLLILFSISICQIFVSKMDGLMIGNLKGFGDLGQYAFSLKVGEIASFIPLTFMMVVLPYLSQSRSNSELYYKLATGCFQIATLTGLCISILILILSPLVVPALLGSQYSFASNYLSYYTIQIVLNFNILIASKILITSNQTQMLLTGNLIMLGTSFLMNTIFIPHLGVYGAISATIITSITVLLYWVSHPSNNEIFKNFFKLKNSMILIKHLHQ